MRTKFYLSTLLALTIQVMVNGQTPGTQGSSTTKLGAVVHHHSASSSSVKKGATMDGLKVIQAEQMTLATVKAPGNYKPEAADLIQKSNTLKEAAQNSKGIVKQELITEANELFTLAQDIQIKAFETSGAKNKETYEWNKTSINSLLEKSNMSAVAGKEVQNLISDATLNMRIASEMRQEAYAMPTNAAKLGSLSNADDKETVAISDQNQAIHILKSYAAVLAAGIDLDSYAVK